MKSKNWILVSVLVPMAVFFSACNNHNNDDHDPAVSPYTGVWVREAPLKEFVQFRDQATGREDLDGFCAAVSAHREVHGLNATLTGGVMVDALLVQVNGEVSRYSPNIRSLGANPAFAQSLKLGTVSSNGDFNRCAPQAVNSRFSTLSDPRLYVVSGSFYKVDDQHLLITDSRDDGQKSYVRSDDNELRNYHAAVVACMHYLRGGDPGGATGQQTQTVIVAPGAASPNGAPPGAYGQGAQAPPK